MSELRHLKVKWAEFLIRSSKKIGVLQKLQTISTVFHEIDDDFLANVRNIKYLGITTWWVTAPDFIDLQDLQKLETLKCSSLLKSTTRESQSKINFPPSLRKLTLITCIIPQGFTATLSSLDNLEVLKIRACHFECQEIDETAEQEESWDATEENFGSLKFLFLENLKLVHWQADKTCFPKLERLLIHGCSVLEEIPCGIGEIPTLD